MPKPLTIIEIQNRSDQGMTRPFLCRCDDDQLYFVKGRSAGPRSLICEWLGGHLAKAFGLPVPDFAVASASAGLLDMHPEGRDLGLGPLFASRQVRHAQELSIAHLGEVPEELQRDVLVFDWWINNGDRTLTTRSGNPNLLWDTDRRQLVVIDHNLAFEPGFDDRSFSETHVFAGQIPLIDQDLVEPLRLRDRCREALDVWDEACKTVPPEWSHVDAERTVATDFDRVSARALLDRYETEHFWRPTP
jgi:hypothetical protein